MNIKKHITAPIVLAALVMAAGCSPGENHYRVSLTRHLEKTSILRRERREQPLHFAIATMITPEETVIYYKKILDYVSRKLGRDYVLIQRTTYEQTNDLIRDGSIDMAFICSGAYVELAESGKVEILAAPVTEGKALYYSYLIVPATSGAKDFSDLRGKTFAFVDPLSNTGFYYPLMLLLHEAGGKASEFFSATTYTYSHTASIRLVQDGNVDGAAVNSLVYEFMADDHPEIRKKTRIIKRSPPYASPPFVVQKNIDEPLKNQLRNILLNMDRDPEGKEILTRLNIQRFAIVHDFNYNSIRAMFKLVVGKKE